MKKWISAILALALVMLFSNTVMGAVESFGPNDIDTWYSIEDEEPYYTGLYADSPTASAPLFMGGYYQNDFFFINGVSFELFGERFTFVQGSYMFEDGFFIGFGYGTGGGSSTYLLSPGYRWAFDDRSYLALSLDYSDEEVEGLWLNGKYCLDAMKLTGWVQIENGGDSALLLDLAYQLSDELVIGGGLYYSGGYTSFSVGATWKTGSEVVDLYFDDDGDYAVSCVFYFGNYGVGAEYDGEVYILKAKYNEGDSCFILRFVPEQSSAFMEYAISYTVKL